MVVLTGLVRRYLAAPFMRSYIAQGFSANKALLSLRGEGLGYRRKTFLADYAILRGQATFRHQYIARGEPDVIPDDLIQERPSGVNKPYIYKTRIYGWDEEQGKHREKWVTIGSDYKITSDEILSTARDRVFTPENSWELYKFRPIRYHVGDAYKHEGWIA